MKLQPIRKATVVERLVAEVRGQITSGSLVAGEPLPPQEKLAAEFGVSRPLLREALAELRNEGFIETVSGRGTFVRRPSESDLAQAFSRHLLLAGAELGPTTDDLYEARQAIELVAAELAATRATEDSVATLRRLLEGMRESRDDAAAYTAADVGFHVSVARATMNPLLPTLLAPIVTMIVKGMFETHGLTDAVDLGIAAHGRVLAAIERGDAASARRAMAAHLHESRQLFPARGASASPDRRRRAPRSSVPGGLTT